MAHGAHRTTAWSQNGGLHASSGARAVAETTTTEIHKYLLNIYVHPAPPGRWISGKQAHKKLGAGDTSHEGRDGVTSTISELLPPCLISDGINCRSRTPLERTSEWVCGKSRVLTDVGAQTRLTSQSVEGPRPGETPLVLTQYILNVWGIPDGSHPTFRNTYGITPGVTG